MIDSAAHPLLADHRPIDRPRFERRYPVDEIGREILRRCSAVELVMLEDAGLELPLKLRLIAQQYRESPPAPRVNQTAKLIAANTELFRREQHRRQQQRKKYQRRAA